MKKHKLLLRKPKNREKRANTGKDKFVYPDDLPIETQTLDIPEEEKVFPETQEFLRQESVVPRTSGL